MCVVGGVPLMDRIADNETTVQCSVQSKSECTVHVLTQPWAQPSHEWSKNIGTSIDVAWFPNMAI